MNPDNHSQIIIREHITSGQRINTTPTDYRFQRNLKYKHNYRLRYKKSLNQYKPATAQWVLQRFQEIAGTGLPLFSENHLP